MTLGYFATDGSGRNSDADGAVCSLCTNSTRCCRRGCAQYRGGGLHVIHPFRFPIGLGYRKDRACRSAPGLGVDHAWLPVTHIGGPKKGPTDSGGLWFYYALGCSDLLWAAGRSLLVRNRVHLSVEIDKLLYGGDDREALGRVASWVRRVYPRWGAVTKARRGLGFPNASVEDLLAAAARGLFSSPCDGPDFDQQGFLRPCVCGGRPNGRRLNALSSLAGEKHLLLHVEPLAVQLGRFDTLQLQQQPLGGKAYQWCIKSVAVATNKRPDACSRL